MLSKTLLLFNIDASSQKEAVERLVNAAAAQGKVKDVELVVDAVLHREEEGTTGFGHGIAIPHGKSDGVVEPALVFGRFKQPIEWHAMDDKPVNTLFLILVPESSHQEHLQMLAKLARKLMHDEFVATLSDIHDSAGLFEFLSTELA